MKKFLFVFFCAIPFLMSAQWVEQFRIKAGADFISTDNLLNIYRVQGAEIYKYDKTGDFKFRFSDNQLGKVGKIDVTFPMRPLVAYPDLNYIVLLDNTLSENRGKINLMDHNIPLATLACASIQNHFWFYDAMSFSLIRTNDSYRNVQQTGNLAQILRINLEPTHMEEFANRLYVNNPGTGILVFDIFGTYIKTIPIKGLSRFQVFENHLIYFANNTIYRYNFKTFDTSEILLPVKAEDAQVQKNRVVALLKDEIVVFDYTMPD